ncbi:Predicted arabinose efflux permease, MFS family [Lentzea albidocapillata subsp. violacea]|uniref:Predicted arabinose efflux permease, MFS family n=1 Tax=Lentzea albidocapillata subsp. violacea TaxID=128104 RepID=A0A1G9PSJ3_9PSEU|nr:MFS transporter [Lentzea albidocapillata]SDM01762.1 Predicted arabinose efflux permease, MFS family [Lentzea albidocapillata subsp. violacea]
MGVPLRKNVQFQLLWLGGAVSQLGTTMTTLAMPLLVVALTGSYLLPGVIAGARAAALLFTLMPAGVWVDRWDRGRTLVWSQSVQALAAALLAAAILTGHAYVVVFVALAIVDGVCTAFSGPARTAAIQTVVPRDQLTTAYAQEEARGHAARVAGPPLGALLMAVGRALPFVADAITFAVAAICAWFARIPARADQQPRRRMHHDVKDAGRWLWHQTGLRNLTIIFLVLNLLGGASMLPVFALVAERGGSGIDTGLVLAGIGVGGIIGSLLSPRITVAPGPLMVAVLTVFGACTLAMALPFGVFWPFVPLALSAVVTPLINVSVSALHTALVPEDMMGRLDAISTLTSRVLTPLAPALGGLLAGVFGGAVALLAFGALILVTAAGAAFTDLRTVVPQKP